MRKLFIVAAMLMASMFANAENIIVAYVTAGSNEVPDPTVMTHINYAFGGVNQTFNGVNVGNPDRLRMIVGLKQYNLPKTANASLTSSASMASIWIGNTPHRAKLVSLPRQRTRTTLPS